MKRFEYKEIIERLNDSKLNKLGADGWELVHFVVRDFHGFCYIFKKELV